MATNKVRLSEIIKIRKLYSKFKMLSMLSITMLLIKLVMEYSMYSERNEKLKSISESLANLRLDKKIIASKKLNMKYVLLWTDPKTVPFSHIGEGTSGFVSRNCKHINCYVTSNKILLPLNQFDAVLFAGPQIYTQIENLKTSGHSKEDYIFELESIDQKLRSPHQKFVFASIESSHNYPICTDKFNGFFNWTWTYKLDSDIRWGYLTIRDSNNKIIGPRKDMHWMKKEDMLPISEELEDQLSHKYKAVAWFVSNCVTSSKREEYALELQRALKKLNLDLDVFGTCTKSTEICPKNMTKLCYEMIRKEYYFYLAFENGLSEDYVTEKLYIPLKYNTIPIVYGGANYSRFMPDDIYLNAMEMTPNELAIVIDEMINDKDRYYEYFRWTNHYSYHLTLENEETNEYCRFCEMLNSQDKVEKKTVYEDFVDWWTPHELCGKDITLGHDFFSFRF